MKLLAVALLTGLFFSSITWETDIDKAKQSAKSSNKLIILNFSGSDWCGPCIRMHKEIFGSPAFEQYASNNLVMVNADFPRLRKNQLAPAQQTKNDKLADQYNKEGKFPMTVLLDAEGKVLKSWEGLPHLSPEEFINEIKAVANAGR